MQPLDTNLLSQLHNNYLSSQKQTTAAAPKKKGNLFTNLLPAIGGGLGAVAGIPLDFLGGAGSIAGAAGGSALGEALKEKLLGENLSAKQIGIQGLEGGATSLFQPLKLLKGASGAAKGFVTAGADTAAQTADKAAMQAVDDSATKLSRNLITQGQQAQGRVAGLSAGSKVAGKELTPQDTATMLGTLKMEKINTGNANNALRDIQDKLVQYGKQIDQHFTANNAPLSTADTKSLASQFLNNVKTTDPTVLKQATIAANDLEKNVKDTKSLWQFRKMIDSQIPDTKFGTDAVSTAKVGVLKDMRNFINSQLGDVPGSANYHALAEIKPFISAEAKRLNNPGGGLLGRLAASGPVQKAESALGNVTESVGNKFQPVNGKLVPTAAQAVPDALDQSVISNVRAAGNRVVDRGDTVDIVSKDGSTTTFPRNDFNNLGKRPTSVPSGTVPQDGSGVGSILQSQVPQDLTSALEQASASAGQIGEQAAKGLPATSRAAQALNALKGTATLPLRAAAAPLAYPGKSLGQVGKQVAGRAIGNAATAGGEQPAQAPADLTSAIMQAGDTGTTPDTSTATQSPYTQEDLQYDIQRDPTNASKYMDYYNSLDTIYNPKTDSSINKPTAQQYGLAQSGVTSLQQLSDAISQDPSILEKNATPGQGLPLVGSLISNAAGAGNYHSLADNILSSLIHLQTGATATESEVTAARGQLPQPGDSESTRQRKLQTLYSNFTPFLGGAQ